MARYPIVTQVTPNSPLTVLVDTQGKVQGVILQNVGGVDVYVSEDPNRLQTTSPANLPNVGLHFPADSPAVSPLPVFLVLPQFKGKLYARAQAVGGLMESIVYDIC